MFLPPNDHINQLYEIYDGAGEIIMVLEYMPGKDLYHRIKEVKTMSEIQAFVYFSQIVKGVQFLHENGIAHRDLKPDNILFSDSETLKIADFSLANYFYLRLRGICGTPGFMAPEIFYQDSYNEKVDVFSLGVILYSM